MLPRTALSRARRSSRRSRAGFPAGRKWSMLRPAPPVTVIGSVRVVHLVVVFTFGDRRVPAARVDRIRRTTSMPPLGQAAERVTPEAINFMAKFGRGLICVAMTGERLDHLRIGMMTAV